MQVDIDYLNKCKVKKFKMTQKYFGWIMEVEFKDKQGCKWYGKV